MQFTSIVIAGGALKVVSVIGCIKYLEEKKIISNLRNFVGTSAGSIMCLFMILGYTYSEIIDFFVHNLSDEKINKLDPDECLELLNQYGLNSGINIELFVTRIIGKKIVDNENITFLDLAKKTGKNLVVCVANLSKERPEYFSVDTMPNLSIATAIRVSCSIPLLFTPISINEDIYLDGGLYNNFPIDYFKNNTLKDILGINIKLKIYQKTDTFLNYIMFMINSLIVKANMVHSSVNDIEKNIITLEFDENDWFSFTELGVKFPPEKWVSYINFGYHKIKQEFTSLQYST